jgi:hypothetical protein
MTARNALAFPNVTIAGAEAPAYNGRDINSVARPDGGGGFSCAPAYNGWDVGE